MEGAEKYRDGEEDNQQERERRKGVLVLYKQPKEDIELLSRAVVGIGGRKYALASGCDVP